MRVALIDYGAGNVPSVERALQRLGVETQCVNSAEDLATARALILPGVGHYSALVRALDEHNLRATLVHSLERGTPFLGICLGLQVLFRSSAEAPELQGLHLLPGKVSALPTTVKLPHMGWNRVTPRRQTRLLEGVPVGSFFYFAHTFAALHEDFPASATCAYGAEFAALIEHKNIFAVQFHPEKSGEAGARVLKNFLRLAA